MLKFVFAFALVAGFATGCHSKAPELTVLGAHREVVYVQVTNPANRPMKLTKLEYTFAAQNVTLSQGVLPLDEREVPAGSTVVVEVPLDASSDAPKAVTLTGKLTAELDEIVRIFSLSAQIQPHG